MNRIETTVSSLVSIINSGEPINPDMLARHDERVSSAKRYKKEIDYHALMLQGEKYKIVAKNTFEKIISKSDFVEIEENEFIRIAVVVNFPEFQKRIYVWLTPISEL